MYYFVVNLAELFRAIELLSLKYGKSCKRGKIEASEKLK